MAALITDGIAWVRLNRPVPGRGNRKRIVRCYKHRYRGRRLIENASCRLKGFRRVAPETTSLP